MFNWLKELCDNIEKNFDHIQQFFNEKLIKSVNFMKDLSFEGF